MKEIGNNLHALLFIHSFTRRSINRNVRSMTGEIFPIVGKCLIQSLSSRWTWESKHLGELFVERTPVAQCLDPRRETCRNDKVLCLCGMSGNVENCLRREIPLGCLWILSLHVPKLSICFLVEYCYNLGKDYMLRTRK